MWSSLHPDGSSFTHCRFYFSCNTIFENLSNTDVSSWLNLALQYPPVVTSENSGRCADSRTCRWLQVCCRFHCSMQPHLTFFSLCVAPNSWMACLLISVQKLSKEMFWPLGTPICCRTWPKPSSFSTVCKWRKMSEVKWVQIQGDAYQNKRHGTVMPATSVCC